MEERGSFKIVTVAGVPVRVHYSLVLVLPFVALAFAAQFGAAAREAGLESAPDSIGPYGWGAILAIFLFVAVVLHELGHALVARHYGATIRGITLWALGGVARMEGAPRRPWQEAVLAAAGPAVSVAIAAACMGAGRALSAQDLPSLRLAVIQLGWVNAVLAVFNMLPAFPMDGGRVLRVLTAWRLGEPRGTLVAATIGKVFAVLFGLLGLMSGNLFLVLIAFFIFAAGNAEAQMVRVKTLLARYTASDFMSARPETIPALSSVDDAAALLAERRRVALPVVEDGRLVGLFSVQELDRVRPDRRPAITVADVARTGVPTARRDEPLAAVAERMERAGVLGIPVVEDGQVLGIVDRDDLARALRLGAAEHAEERFSRPRPQS